MYWLLLCLRYLVTGCLQIYLSSLDTLLQLVAHSLLLLLQQQQLGRLCSASSAAAQDLSLHAWLQVSHHISYREPSCQWSQLLGKVLHNSHQLPTVSL